MHKKQKHIKKSLALAIIAVAIFLAIWCLQFTFSRPTFNAEKIAHLETQMWQSYYSGDKIELGLQLVALLRSQYGLSLLEAKNIGELLASSAMKFHTTHSDYEIVVLPDLIKAYALIQKATRVPFDPNKVARAELAWWVARRTPGHNSTKQVGAKITELYVVIYGHNSNAFTNAGQLRAQAALILDADWKLIEDILCQAYIEFNKGISED